MKEIKLFNGRWERGEHIYVGAYSMADASRILREVAGHGNWLGEVKVYFSKGCWGNSMDGVKHERGAWVQKHYSDKPVRVL